MASHTDLPLLDGILDSISLSAVISRQLGLLRLKLLNLSTPCTRFIPLILKLVIPFAFRTFYGQHACLHQTKVLSLPFVKLVKFLRRRAAQLFHLSLVSSFVCMYFVRKICVLSYLLERMTLSSLFNWILRKMFSHISGPLMVEFLSVRLALSNFAFFRLHFELAFSFILFSNLFTFCHMK